MSTQAQIDANRANAQCSTGPRSSEGKAAVSQNARRHGLSSQYLPLSDAERPRFEALEQSLRENINPNGALQESIFRELAAAVWKRDIVNRLIAEASAASEALFEDEPSDRLRKLHRHKADQDRAANRAMRLLKELQTNDLYLANLPVGAPGLANYARFTKQTQSAASEPEPQAPPQAPEAPQPPAEPTAAAPVLDMDEFRALLARERKAAFRDIMGFDEDEAGPFPPTDVNPAASHGEPVFAHQAANNS